MDTIALIKKNIAGAISIGIDVVATGERDVSTCSMVKKMHNDYIVCTAEFLFDEAYKFVKTDKESEYKDVYDLERLISHDYYFGFNHFECMKALILALDRFVKGCKQKEEKFEYVLKILRDEATNKFVITQNVMTQRIDYTLLLGVVDYSSLNKKHFLKLL